MPVLASLRHWRGQLALAATAALGVLAGSAYGAPIARNDDAIRVSEFGERPDFSPDGKQIAFVGKGYGDAFEMDVATRAVRNLTNHAPNQGILRVQYLPNGDYLINAPRRYEGRISRFNAELWVLKKDGTGLLQPLDVHLFEGAAVSRGGDKIAWVEFGANYVKPTIVDGKMKFDTNPNAEMVLMTGDLVLDQGAPRVVNRREVLRRKQSQCYALEPQDFRPGDRELLFNCYYHTVEGVDLATGKTTVYWDAGASYIEAEGIAPDGKTMLVECGGPPTDRGALIDICELDLKPGGARRKLIAEPRPSMRMSTNPVISPDGKWIAFSDADRMDEAGAGRGILLIRKPAGAPITTP